MKKFTARFKVYTINDITFWDRIIEAETREDAEEIAKKYEGRRFGMKVKLYKISEEN